MKIKIGNEILNLKEIKNEEYNYSKLYGRNLYSFDCNISINESDIDEFKEMLKNCYKGEVYKLDKNDQNIEEYKICNYSYMYSRDDKNENTVYNFTLKLEEIVRLDLELLKIGDLEVKPYEYKEDYDDALIIEAKIKLSKDEMDLFKSIENGERYFKVVRKGINDKAISMRFGRNIWSEENDNFKVSIILVEDVYDINENNIHDVSEIQLQNIMNMLAYQKNLNNELMKLLLDKNILTDTELDEVKNKSQNNIKDVCREFLKVNDIDK